MKFEEIMNLLMDITKTELFTTMEYKEVMKEKGHNPFLELRK